MKRFFLVLSFAFFVACQADTEHLNVAVASNFASTAEQLREAYEKKTGRTFRVQIGSTGKIAAQIRNGADIDLFFSADTRTVDGLIEEGVGSESFVYASGIPVFLHPGQPSPQKPSDFPTIAIANPSLAPYGKAAEEFLENYKGTIVKGENVGQAFQMVKSGAAPAGVVAYSQVLSDKTFKADNYTRLPRSSVNRLRQSVLLISNENSARDFYEFTRTTEAVNIIKKNGYDVGDD